MEITDMILETQIEEYKAGIKKATEYLQREKWAFEELVKQENIDKAIFERIHKTLTILYGYLLWLGGK
jgi:hypothetical protein